MSSKSVGEEAITIGKRIRAARRRHDWTQEELAQKVGASKPTVYRWEAAKVKMSAESLGKVADVLGVSEMWLRGAGEINLQTQGAVRNFAISDDPHSAARRYAVAIRRKTPEGDGYKIADRRDIERQHGSRASQVEYVEIRASSMEHLIQRGQDVEVHVSSEYTGPGLYLIRLVEGEYPHPAYLVRRNPTRYRIIYDNSQTIFEVVKGDGGWEDAETGEPVDFQLVGSVEKWPETRAELSR
jgi:transcriptional regulator with XRE-family HTH domain